MVLANKDIIINTLNKLEELVNNCDSRVPQVAVNAALLIEIALFSGNIDCNTSEKFLAKLNEQTLKFSNSCLYMKNV